MGRKARRGCGRPREMPDARALCAVSPVTGDEPRSHRKPGHLQTPWGLPSASLWMPRLQRDLAPRGWLLGSAQLRAGAIPGTRHLAPWCVTHGRMATAPADRVCPCGALRHERGTSGCPLGHVPECPPWERAMGGQSLPRGSHLRPPILQPHWPSSSSARPRVSTPWPGEGVEWVTVTRLETRGFSFGQSPCDSHWIGRGPSVPPQRGPAPAPGSEGATGQEGLAWSQRVACRRAEPGCRGPAPGPRGHRGLRSPGPGFTFLTRLTNDHH